MDPIQLASLQQSSSPFQVSPNHRNQVAPAEVRANFAEQLKNAISHVNEMQHKSDVKTNQLVNGENVDLHDVMITAQQAGITLQAATEIQNRVIEAYREVMRMQV